VGPVVLWTHIALAGLDTLLLAVDSHHVRSLGVPDVTTNTDAAVVVLVDLRLVVLVFQWEAVALLAGCCILLPVTVTVLAVIIMEALEPFHTPLEELEENMGAAMVVHIAPAVRATL
jgi:hypothetical protein